MKIHLLLPGLLPNLKHWPQISQSTADFHFIEKILAKSRGRRSSQAGYEITLCGLFGLYIDGNDLDSKRDLPLAAITRFALTDDADAAPFLAADPVHLKADIHQLHLIDSHVFGISMLEAQALSALCNAHFADEPWQVEVHHPQHWHIRLVAAEDVCTEPLREVMGQSVDPRLPGGTRGKYWHGVMNEIQMLFHNAEVNRQREARGMQSINSIWLSGAGLLPTLNPQKNINVWANDLLAQGLAKVASSGWHALPENLYSLLNDARNATQIICIEDLLRPARYDDFNEWQEKMCRLEDNWFAPLLKTLKAGDIDELQLHDCAGQCFSLRRHDLLRFWCKAQPLHHYVTKQSIA